MSEIKVLMFCPQFRPLIGGAERQAEKLATALAAINCEVRILTPRIDSESPDVEEINGVRIQRFPMTDLSHRWPFPGIAILNIPFILWQVIRAVLPHIREADLLHAHIATLQTLGAVLAARIARKPGLCKAAIAGQRSDLGELEMQGPAGKLIAVLNRMALEYWIATTHAVAQALLNAGVKKNRIVQIPNGISLTKDKYERLRPVRNFLYLGRLSSNIERDVPTLIHAFDALAASLPNAELALVGGGDLLESTRELVKSCEARQRIHLPGFDIPEKWLKWADCFVLPSRREGLSNALLEAMAAKLPCIANDIPPNREVLEDGLAGVLVPVGAINSLAEEMLRMATDTAHSKKLRIAARSRVESQYDIKLIAARYLDFYRQIIDTHVREHA